MAGVPVASPFIGRSAERALLSRALEGAKKGRGGVVVVSGPTGIGKTRLLDVTADEATSLGFHVVRGQAAEGDVQPYSSIRRALPGTERTRGKARSLLRSRDPGGPTGSVPDSTPGSWTGLEPTARAVGSRVGAGSQWGGMALGELLAPSGGTEVKLEELPPLGASLRILEQLEEVADGAPLLVVLEAFHWADPGSLAAIRPLAREARKRSIAVLLSFESEEASPEEDRREVESLARAIQRESGALRVSLKGLSDAEARKLSEEILQAPLVLEKDGTLPPVLARAGGNPFLVQELLRAGLRDGWITRRGEGFRVMEPSQDLQVPTLLRWWVHRRISTILPNDLSLLEAISVLGSEFDPRALSTLLPERAADLRRGLERLEKRHGLVHQVRPGLWRLEPAFLASVLRAEMSGELRRRLHRRAGEWQAAHDPAAVERIASHYVEASEPSLALPWIFRAWQAAADRSDNDAAMRFCRWGEEMGRASNRPEEDMQWRVREARSLMQLGEVKRGHQVLEDALAVSPPGLSKVLLRVELAPLDLALRDSEGALRLLAEAAAEPVPESDRELARVRVASMRIDIFSRSQRWTDVVREAPELLETGAVLDERRRCRVLNAYGTALTAFSRFGEAREALMDSISRARKAGLVASESNSRSTLGVLAVSMGDLAVGRAIFEQASEEWGRRGGITNQAINTGNAAETMLLQGDLESAREWIGRAWELADLCGLRRLRADLSPVLARCYLLQGDTTKAEQVLAEIEHDPAVAVGSDTYREFHATRARIFRVRGDKARAWEEAKLAGPEPGGLGGWISARTYAICQGEVGQPVPAQKLLLSLIEETQRLGRKMDLALCLETLGDLYHTEGRASEARARWDEALGLMRACGALARAARLDEKRRHPQPSAP